MEIEIAVSRLLARLRGWPRLAVNRSVREGPFFSSESNVSGNVVAFQIYLMALIFCSFLFNSQSGFFSRSPQPMNKLAPTAVASFFWISTWRSSP